MVEPDAFGELFVRAVERVPAAFFFVVVFWAGFFGAAVARVGADFPFASVVSDPTKES